MNPGSRGAVGLGAGIATLAGVPASCASAAAAVLPPGRAAAAWTTLTLKPGAVGSAAELGSAMPAGTATLVMTVKVHGFAPPA